MRDLLIALLGLEGILFFAYCITWVFSIGTQLRFKSCLRKRGSNVLGKWVTKGPAIDFFAAPVRISFYLLFKSYKQEANAELRELAHRSRVQSISLYLLIISMFFVGFAIVLLFKIGG